jgi:transposase
MRTKGTAAELEQRRRLAVQRVADGWTQRDVADFLGVSERSVGRWVAAHRVAGEDGLDAQPRVGHPRLSPDQDLQVLAWLLRPATDFGFPTALWTARRVAKLIDDRLGVAFHPDYLREWLRARGYTPQKPETRARERDEEAIRRWAQEQWPALKKKPATREPTSS